MKNLRVIVDALSSNVYPSNILSFGYSGANVEEEILCVEFSRHISGPDPDP